MRKAMVLALVFVLTPLLLVSMFTASKTNVSYTAPPDKLKNSDHHGAALTHFKVFVVGLSNNLVSALRLNGFNIALHPRSWGTTSLSHVDALIVGLDSSYSVKEEDVIVKLGKSLLSSGKTIAFVSKAGTDPRHLAEYLSKMIGNQVVLKNVVSGLNEKACTTVVKPGNKGVIRTCSSGERIYVFIIRLTGKRHNVPVVYVLSSDNNVRISSTYVQKWFIKSLWEVLSRGGVRAK